MLKQVQLILDAPASGVAPSLVQNISLSNQVAAQLQAAVYKTSSIAGNNVQAAWAYANGTGTTVAVIDEGFDATQFKAFSTLSKAFGTTSYAPASTTKGAVPTHGQMVSAVLASTDSEAAGPSGIAPYANLLAAGISYKDSSQADFANALQYSSMTGRADVVNCSWNLSGFQGDTYNASYLQPWFATVQQATHSGRNGLGTTIVFAAGNDRAHANDVGLHAQQEDPRVITAAATNVDGSVAAFSTGGAGLLTAAVGVGDMLLSNGRTWKISGTSFAAPVVSGIIDLMYSVNVNLGWRDVQEIIVRSSYIPAAAASSFICNAATGTTGGWNGGGMHFSRDLGFGQLDAKVAINLAKAWDTVLTDANLATICVSSTHVLSLKGTSTSVSDILAFAQGLRVEHVQVILGDSALLVSHMKLILISPNGTRSTLLNEAGLENSAGTRVGTEIAVGTQGVTDGTNGMQIGNLNITSNAFWGENTKGNWQIVMQDAFGNDIGTLSGWSLKVWGDDLTKESMPLVYTPEFSTLASTDTARTLVSNGGNRNIKTVDLISLDKASFIDLGGGKGLIDGIAVTVQTGFLNAKANGSTGDVTLIGTKDNNILYGGDGNTRIDGGGGNDTIVAGFGSTSVTTGTGKSTVDFKSTVAGTSNTLISGGADVVTMGAGDLAVNVGGAATDTITGSSGRLSVTLGGQAIARMTGGSGNLVLTQNGGTVLVTQGSGQLFLTLNGGKANIVGSNGAATIRVTTGTLSWRAGKGDLTFIGGNSVVSLSGGAGRQTIVMGGGGGSFTAGSGYVTYTGGAGTERIAAGSGGGTYALGTGKTTFIGGSTSIRVDGGKGTAVITSGFGGGVFIAGSGGNSVLVATAANCELHGRVSGDRLIASATGADKLWAGAGTEVLDGSTSKLGNTYYDWDSSSTSVSIDRTGNTTFIGGFGADRFMFTMQRGSMNTIIKNFDVRQDLLDLASYTSAYEDVVYTKQTSDGHGGTILNLLDGKHIDLLGVIHLDRAVFV